MELNKKLIAGIVVTLALLITSIVGFNEIWHRNDDQNWQVVQSLTGDVSIRSDPGWFMAPGAKIWTWPKASDTEVFGPFNITFNDGGTANMTGVFRYRMPITTEKQRLLHREFSSAEDSNSHGLESTEKAITAHLNNCLKNTGPMMSSSEYQTARKGEFYRVVDEQFRKGLYQTRKVEREMLGQKDEEGKPVLVLATEVILGDNGQPTISEPSPLAVYGIDITQFSITDTIYDDATLKQFASKKDAFLAAENSKAQRESQIAERMMVEERGKKEKAEVEAQANKVKATAVIQAQQEVEVASAQARQAEESKKRAVIEANREKEVAQLRLEASKLDAEGVKVKASAEEERIRKAGAITEEKRVLAEIDANARVGVAAALAKVAVPSTYIAGGSPQNGSGDQGGLMNLILLRAAGLLPAESRPSHPEK